MHFDENAPDSPSRQPSPGSSEPDPSTANVTVPAGGTRVATGPASVTVATHVAAVPGERPFGVQLIESFVGFAACAVPGTASGASRSSSGRNRHDLEALMAGAR